MGEQKRVTENSLFDIYSKNLGYINPELEDTFICPICFEKYYRSDIEVSENKEPSITIEHVPPKSLGGKHLTLTCKKCNNHAGRELDSDLLNSLLLRDFLESKPKTWVDSVIDSNGKKIRAKLEADEKARFRLSYPGNRNNPKDLEEFQKSFPQSMKISFSGEYQKPVRVNRPDWSILRIAYLWAFSVFGYGFLLTNPNLKILREQINNPEKEILKYWAYESNLNLSDRFLGVNLVEAPYELRSFLIVFDLVTPNSKRRYGALLLGPTKPGINIYETLLNAPDRKSELSVRRIPTEIEYLKNPKLCMISNIFWNKPKEV